MFPITAFVIEDIKARTWKNGRRWNVSFSPLEVGKSWFYAQLQQLGILEIKSGIETKELRDSLGLKKIKNKLAEKFEAHNFDSFVLANWYTGGHTQPENRQLLVVIPLRFHRRQLHRLEHAPGSVRPRYGGTISAGFKRGSIVQHKKYGLCYVGGFMDSPTQRQPERKVISLHSLETGKRLTQNALPADINFLCYNSWRTRYAASEESPLFPPITKRSTVMVGVSTGGERWTRNDALGNTQVLRVPASPHPRVLFKGDRQDFYCIKVKTHNCVSVDCKIQPGNSALNYNNVWDAKLIWQRESHHVSITEAYMPRAQKNDNFIDKSFTVMADIILKIMPANKKAKEAFVYYRDGMSAQADGEYAEALDNYNQALELEEDSYDRSYILYNMGLIHASNGEHEKALEYYEQALECNHCLPQALNNIAVIYHYQGEQAKEAGDRDAAENLFNKAADYWRRAIQFDPNNYLEAQNWLKTTGRLPRNF